jgi:hypothetical protein
VRTAIIVGFNRLELLDREFIPWFLAGFWLVSGWLLAGFWLVSGWFLAGFRLR